MKSILIVACILGMAVCAPNQMYMEFDLRHAPAQAAQAIPAGAAVGSLDVLLPVDDQKQPLAGPVRGFIKQEILEANGRDTKDVYFPFGFEDPASAPVAPAAAAPAAPAAPAAAAPAVPAAPAAPAVPAAPAAKPNGDDDDDDDD